MRIIGIAYRWLFSAHASLFDTQAMDATPSFTAAAWAEQLAAERARRERAEAALALAEARLAAMAAPLPVLPAIPGQTPDPILQLSATGEVLYASATAAPLLRALAADTPATLREHLLALVPAVSPGPPSGPHLLAGADEHACLLTVAGPSYLTLYLTSDAALRRAEQQCAYYRSVLEQVPAAIGVFDAEHRYLFLNPAVEPDPAIRQWMLGRTCAEVCAHEQRDAAVIQQRAAAFATAVSEQREVSWEEANSGWNRQQHLLLRYRPVLGPDSLLVWVVASAVDITEQKQAEADMARQKEFYEFILNLLPVDVAVFDADHRFRFVNPLSISDPAVRAQVIGLTNAEYVALRQAHLPAGLAEQRAHYFDLAARTRTGVTWEEMSTDRQQRPQLMLRHLRPAFNPDGTLRLMVGAGINITTRYLAERLQQQVQAKLQEQQAFIRQVVDTLASPLYVQNGAGHIYFTNKAFDAQAVHSAHNQSQPPSAVVMEERRQLQRLNEQVLATRQAVTREMPFTMSNGRMMHFHMHKSPLRLVDGQVDILTLSTDVTAVKLARQALEHREKQYRDLVQYSQALICTHDMLGNLLSVNPAIEELLGVPAARLVGRNLRQVLPPSQRTLLRAYLWSVRTTPGQPRTLMVHTGSGEVRYLHYYTYQVTGEGDLSYVVASGYDVTPGVLAERDLQQAKQEAEANAHAKEAFLARMSHEIRTPLNGVLGMAGLLQKTPLTATQREYLDTMQHAGRHLLALLNDVLDMAKITADHLQINQAPFDVALALQGAGQAVAALAAEKGLALVVEPLPPGLPRVLGDSYRLHQVLLNLLGNALKFTESGTVRLGAAVWPGTDDELVLRFQVQDTGIGMTPEEQATIFEAFTQASTETSRRFGGTGLGLAISQQLVEQMGGVLRVASEPGQGTTFSFQLALPHALEAATALAPGRPAVSYEPLRGLRVLLAEDNSFSQLIAVVLLENLGLQVQAVSNGLDALARLQAEVFDVAILDIQMPGLSGVEVTTAIRRHPEAAHADLPIIALTANAFESDLVKYLAAGMTACLTKPYEEADLGRLLLELTAK